MERLGFCFLGVYILIWEGKLGVDDMCNINMFLKQDNKHSSTFLQTNF